MRRMRSLVVSLVFCVPAAAQQLASAGATPVMSPAAAPRAAIAVRASRAPVIDGRDDDAIWERAQVIEGFRMFEPVENGPERFHTVARVAYDDANLYVLVRAYDPHPDSIVALLSRRDVRTPSDWIKVMVDSYHDRRTGYEFAVNPRGVKRDYYTFNDGDEDGSWDGVWDAAARVDSLGWVAEFRIPFSQLRFDAARTHTFGLMITREIGRTSERMSWPVYHPSRAGIASQFGVVSGIADIGSPRRLEVTPYAVSKNITRTFTDAAGNVTGYARAQRLTGGADIKYGLSSNLTVDATVNPDFGQVEADPAVLNLTNFETFFEEKRPFFIEGSGIFRFDISCSDGQCNGLFYSRRVGRAPELSGEDGYADPSTPTATTILGAAKLTGRLPGGLSVGVLDAVTQRETGVAGRTVEPGTNYFVGRLQQDFRHGESGVGVMLTSVHRSLDAWSTPYLRRDALTGGVDFRHRFLAHRYELSGFVAGSRIAGSAAAIALAQQDGVHLFQRPDDGIAFDSLRTSLSGDAEKLSVSKVGGGILRFNTSFTRFAPGFEINDVGFLPQAGIQRWSNWVGLQFNTAAHFYRRAFINFNEWQSWTSQGLAAAQRSTIGGNVNAHAELRSGWWGHLGVGVDNVAASFCDYCARGGPAIRQSPSVFGWAGVEGDTRRSVAPSLFVQGSRGDGGRSWSLSASPSVDIRGSSRLTMSVGPDIGRDVVDAQYVDQFTDAAGAVHYTFARMHRTTVAITARASYTFTPDLSLQVYAQPYVSSGRFANWREVGAPRAADYAARYQPYTSPDSTVQLAGYDFNSKAFHSTAVLRWEYRHGSTIFFVWTQGRAQDGLNPGSFAFRRDYRDLFAAHPDNTLLVKASFWVDR